MSEPTLADEQHAERLAKDPDFLDQVQQLKDLIDSGQVDEGLAAEDLARTYLDSDDHPQ